MTNALRPATLDDLDHVGRHLRQTDADEVRLSHGHDPHGAVRYAAENSWWTQALVMDDEPICVFGVGRRSWLGTVGSPWLLGTPGMAVHRRTVLKLSRPLVQQMRQGVSLLENWVWAGNMQSIKWLRFCGFTVEPPQAFGLENAPFHRFYMKGLYV